MGDVARVAIRQIFGTCVTCNCLIRIQETCLIGAELILISTNISSPSTFENSIIGNHSHFACCFSMTPVNPVGPVVCQIIYQRSQR